MTEASYQQARILMRQIVYLKSQINAKKKILAAVGHAVASAQANGNDDLAKNKMNTFGYVEEELNKMRATMAAIVFPPSDLPEQAITARLCRICQTEIEKSEHYCLDCNSNQNLAKYNFAHRIPSAEID